MAEVRPIDANALLGLYKNWLPQLTADKDAGDRNGVETCIAVLEDAHTLDYAPVKNAHVVWKERFRGGFEHNVRIVDHMGFSHVGTHDTRHYEKTPYCSRCGWELGVSSLNYCPNCGAKMEVQEDGHT